MKKAVFLAVLLVLATGIPSGLSAQTPNSPNDFEIANSALGGVKITKYIGTRSNVVIPSTIDGMRVTELDELSFAHPSFFYLTIKDRVIINSVVFPNTIIAIGQRAFERQPLTSISFPNSLRTIGYAAFRDNNFTSVVIPNGVTLIGIYAFSPDAGSTSITSVVIPPSLVNYVNNGPGWWYLTQGFPRAFGECDRINRITLPANVNPENLGQFHNGLRSAYIGNNRQAGTYTWTGRIWSTAADAVPAVIAPTSTAPSNSAPAATVPANSGSSWTTPSNAAALTANQWRNGSLTSGGSVWYSFSANSGTAYRIWVDDEDASGTPTTADVVITGRYSDGTQIWSGNQDDNWNSPASFTANKTGTVYIEVKPYSSGGSGSYGLVFSTGSTRPAASAAAAPVNPAPAVSSADANSSVAAVTRGATHFNNREYDRAITEFTEAIRLNPNNAGAYGWRGAAYYRKSDWDRAIADHTEAIRLEPTASRYYDRGLAYYEKRDYRQARTDVDRALQIDPNHQNSQTLSGYIRQAAAPASGGSSWTTPSNAVALNANQWRNGSLTSGGSVWYSFIANGGYSYRIWVDDADARGTPTTADVGIMVRYSDGTQIWSDYQDDNWNSPASFTANRTGTVYIEVKPLGRGSGSYGLVFSSGSSTRPPQ